VEQVLLQAIQQATTVLPNLASITPLLAEMTNVLAMLPYVAGRQPPEARKRHTSSLLDSSIA
jgi:hypothetical protein